MFLAVYDILSGMLALDDVGTFYVPGTTGPRCLVRSFSKFMGLRSDYKGPLTYTYWKPKAGIYQGLHNRSITVVGDSSSGNEWVIRDALKRKTKAEGWNKMNFTNYQLMNKVPANMTCLQKVLKQHYPKSEGHVMRELERLRR